MKELFHNQWQPGYYEKHRKDYKEIKRLSNLKKEIWKDVKDYEGIYQVSNKLRVKSFYYKIERILKTTIAPSGVVFVNLSKNGSSRSFVLNKVFLAAFLKGYANGKPNVVPRPKIRRKHVPNFEIIYLND